MPPRVTLTVTQGALAGQAFAFDERTSCIIGRADDCTPRLPNDEHHKTISRHHCLLDINPPDIRVRDFGSLNGTYVNGTKIGQRERGQTAEQAAQSAFPEHDLKVGDEIQLGSTILRVSLFLPTLCTECGAEIAEDLKALALRAPGVYQCEACQRKAEQARRPEPPKPKPKVCAACGNDVSKEVGDRQGEYLCSGCRSDPIKVMKLLLEMAKRGDQQLQSIQGYTLLRELGRGGMGAVYLARHDRTGEQVALKVMLPQIAADERAKALFLREVENTRALTHRNVVQLRDSGCVNGTFFFTLEFCDGGSVDKLMQQRGGTLPFEEAVEIVLQALEGVQYAHAAEIPQVKRADGTYGPGHGLVHRDLKPANVFLAGTGRARLTKVADYGLAKAFDTAGLSGQTRTGTISGTPVFMPRQQVVNFKYAKPEAECRSVQ